MPAAATTTLERLSEEARISPRPSHQPAPGHSIAKISYTHDAMIDLIIGNPWISQTELAAHFGYTQGWISQVLASDAFQHRMADRKEKVLDPAIKASFEERLRGLAIQSHKILMEKLDKPAHLVPDALALKGLEMASKALGYGASVHVVPVVPQPPHERLGALKGRLVGLVREVREGEVYDAEVVQVPEARPERQDAGHVQGPQPGRDESSEGAVRAESASSGAPAQ